MPSIVVISLNSGTLFIFLVQARTTSPSRITEQAPQTPVPHPILTPWRPMRRRTTARESSSGSQTANLSTPLMFKLNLASFMSSPLSHDGNRRYVLWKHIFQYFHRVLHILGALGLEQPERRGLVVAFGRTYVTAEKLAT